MKPNTSNNDEDCNCSACMILKEGIKQGYAKALTKILKRLRYRQAKITNLWINTRLKEYEYAKMVLEEEITLIAKLESK